ncbi:MAG: MoaD/ThiS family protein [Fervidicoccaceae archaeon]
MKVIISGISIYSEIIGKKKEVDVNEGVTVGELISLLLPKDAPSIYGLAAFVNGSPSSMDRRLKEGDLLEIAPNFSGG